MMPPFAAGKATPSRGAFDPDGRVMRRYEREFEAAVSRALAKLRRDVERGITDENVNDMVSRLNDPAVTRPFQDSIVEQMQRVALAGAEHGRVTIEREIFGTGKSLEVGMWELANNAAAAWATEYAYGLVRGIIATTRTHLQSQIAEYISNSMSIGDLFRGIAASGGFSLQRAHTIAVTEVTRAFYSGSHAAWKESGVITKQRWNTNNDELVCPICRPLNGKVTGINEPFSGDVSGPPAHVRCRCWATPVVSVSEAVSAGTPVSDALEVSRGIWPQLRDDIQSTLANIDKVHGDGDLPLIPLKQAQGVRTLGQYTYYTSGGKPVEIKLSTISTHPRMTTAHEVGHFLDHQGLGKKGRFSTVWGGGVESDVDEALDMWRNAVRNSQGYQVLADLPDDYEFTRNGKNYILKRRSREYLLSVEELWARSYAQFIAIESGDTQMLKELQSVVDDAVVTGFSNQWGLEDFEPIRAAFRALFVVKGWMK